MKQKVIRIISSILCVFVLLVNISVAHGTQDIDISEKLAYTEFERIEGSNYSMSRTKTQSKKSGVIMTPLLIVFVHETPDFFGKIKTVAFVGTEVDIIEELYWFYLVEVNGAEGYIFRMWLSKDKEEKPEEPAEKPEQEEEAKFNITYDHVYVNKTNVSSTTGKPRAKLLYTGSGEVVYSVSNTNIISVDSKTGLITGKKTGTAYLIASIDGTEKDRIPVYCIYQWEQSWTGKANKSTKIYTGTSASTPSLGTLSSGANFYVKGDDGDSAGWAYGCTASDGDGDWGFVKINDISTKGTVSQYNNMTTALNGQKVPWVWPMYDKSIKNISSPYGPRNITASGSIHHRGYDITTGTQGEIAGKFVVASGSGTVKAVRMNVDSCGYCLSISTDCNDYVTGEKIAIIYMHLQERPKYQNGNFVYVGDYITAGTIIGKVGKTNGNTDPGMGYHLHFETNSQNAAVGDSGRSDFTYTLNPMFFFMDKEVTFSTTKSYNKYGGYWYDLNGGYQNEEIFKSYFNF